MMFFFNSYGILDFIKEYNVICEELDDLHIELEYIVEEGAL